jgi:hypothetical protein
VPVSKFTKAAEAPRVGDFSEGLVNELHKSSFSLIPILDITFPQIPSTQTLYPNENVLVTGWTPVGAGSPAVYETLDDPKDSPDEDTFYTRDNVGTDESVTGRVGFENLTVNPVEITEVRLFCRARLQAFSNGPWSFGLRHDGTTYYRDGSLSLERYINNVYRTMEYRYPVRPDDGEPWTVADIDALVGDFIASPDDQGSGTSHRFTQMFLQVDYTSQDVGQYGAVAVNSRSEGLFEPLIISVDDIDINVMSPSNALQALTCGVVLADTDRNFSTLQAKHRSIRGSAVRLRWISPDLPKTDWFTAFKGILTSYDQVKTNIWRLKFKVDDTVFDSAIPRTKFTEQDFGLAPDPKLYDNFVPQIWGVHDSRELTGDGMVKLWRVSDVEFISSFHRIKAHRKVYTFQSGDPPTIDDTLVQDTDWEESFPIINGRQYSRVTLIGGSAATNKEMEIRADVEGYEDIGDGTGIVITNPALQIAHALVNFVFNRVQSGLWLSNVGEPIDAERLEEFRDFFNNTGQAGARYLGGQSSETNVKQEIQRFTKCTEVKVWWNHQNELAFGVNDPMTLDVYPEEHQIYEGLHDLRGASYSFDGNKILKQIAISYLRQQASNSFLANVTVEDPDVENASDENIQGFWLPSSLPQFISEDP